MIRYCGANKKRTTNGRPYNEDIHNTCRGEQCSPAFIEKQLLWRMQGLGGPCILAGAIVEICAQKHKIQQITHFAKVFERGVGA